MENFLNNKIIEKAVEIVELIKNSDLYKDYINVSSKMKNNKEIMGLIDEVKEIQKQIVKEEYKGIDISSLEYDLNEKLEKLDTYPIYLDYKELQEQLNEEIQMIREKIEKHINEITN